MSDKRLIKVGDQYGCLTVIADAGMIEYETEDRKAFKVKCRLCGEVYFKCNRNITRNKNEYCSKECRKL